MFQQYGILSYANTCDSSQSGASMDNKFHEHYYVLYLIYSPDTFSSSTINITLSMTIHMSNADACIHAVDITLSTTMRMYSGEKATSDITVKSPIKDTKDITEKISE